MLSSSDDECSSYSSDGEDGGGLVIDSAAQAESVPGSAHRNGHPPTDTPPATAYSNSSAESPDHQ